MDRAELIKKQLLTPVDWVTLAPFVAGLALGATAWWLPPDPGIHVAGSVILMLIAAGIYLNRLIFGWSENEARLLSAWRESAERARNTDLDRLYRDLQQDGDPRTEALLKDLRTLTKALMSEQSDNLAVGALDILRDVDVLFQRSVLYLRESLDLWRAAAEMSRESVRDQLLRQREAMIEEVEKSLENLGEVLGGVKKVGLSSQAGPQLEELRQELKSRLRIAEDVEARVRAMRDRQPASQDEARYLTEAGR